MESDDLAEHDIAPEECWTLLRSGEVGRVVFTDRALPAIQPVRYAVLDRQIVIASAARARWAAAVRDAVVAFQVDSFDPAGLRGWSVVVTGRARPLPPLTGGARGLLAGPALTAIAAELVTGRRVTTMETPDPAALSVGRHRRT